MALFVFRGKCVWWNRDSNPGYSCPYVSLANWWFQPLTHPTVCAGVCVPTQMRCKCTH